MEFSKILKQLRKEKGLTQEQLANELSTTVFTIRNYEYNERKPDLVTLIDIANYFDVSVDFLLGRSALKRLNTIDFLSNSKNFNDQIRKLDPQTQYEITSFLNKCYLIIERSLLEKYDSRVLTIYKDIAHSLMYIDAYVGGFLEDPAVKSRRKLSEQDIQDEMKLRFFEKKESINECLSEVFEIYLSSVMQEVENRNNSKAKKSKS